MKKWKFFISFLKERDWLEEMARNGWLLKDITFGMLYHFEEIEPTEKVYEIDRFAVLKKPTKQMLMERKTALDIAKQAGWDIVTHDESMIYYFVKDKAGDESDEFYDESELRRERAEKFRKYFCHDTLRLQLISQFISAIVFASIFVFMFVAGGMLQEIFRRIAWIYVTFTVIDSGYALSILLIGQKTYEELCLSREEWERRKRYGEKKRFHKIGKLLEYLKDKNANGFVLTDYHNGTYLFEETKEEIHYEIDTKQALKKRLKAQGKKYHDEKKDWNIQSLQWYEMSIAEAQSHGLELVCVVDSETLVYKKVCNESDDGEATLLNSNYNESMGWTQKFLNRGWMFLVLAIVGFIVGYLGGCIAASIMK